MLLPKWKREATVFGCLSEPALCVPHRWGGVNPLKSSTILSVLLPQKGSNFSLFLFNADFSRLGTDMMIPKRIEVMVELLSEVLS